MLDGNTNEPRSAAEAYTVATGASNLRSEAHRTGAADSIGAAGMNPHEMGLELMRLQAEWDRAAKPKPPTLRAIQALAASYKVEPVTVEGRRNPNAGLVEVLRQPTGGYAYRKPIELAEEQAMAWHLHELGLLFGHLKTLPAVRAELELWVGPPHAARLVADTLGWWLEPRCLTCRGSGKRIVQGTGGRSSGKVCWACRLSTNPGERPLSHSGIGRRLLAHIRSCYNTAANEQGASKEGRTAGQEMARDLTKHHAKVAKLRQADEAGRADDGQDAAKVAEHFRQSMRKLRP